MLEVCLGKSIKTVAVEINVSVETIHNWIRKLGLSKNKGKLNENDIQILKQAINKKLNTRANKINSKVSFIPKEHFNNNKIEIEKASKIVEFLSSIETDIESKMFILSCFFFHQKGMIRDLKDGLNLNKKTFRNENLYKELNNFKKPNIPFNLDKLEKLKLPIAEDFLGAMYQSLLLEGDKAKNGSYYTPILEVQKIVKTYFNRKDLKVLDPCCGTGSFIICFSQKIKNPENIFGFDSDSLAVKLARLNLIWCYPRKDNFKINIFNKNSLIENQSIKFDLIFTNPPWGFMFNLKEQEVLKEKFSSISSGESYSYFILACMDMLKPTGILSFLLPESILKIKTHKDIREQMLNNSSIKQIHFLGNIFNKVMTNVVRIDLVKKTNPKNKIKINYLGKKSVLYQERFKKNTDFQFDIQTNSTDESIIEKVFSKPYKTLKNNSIFALGIVTGNNDLFLKNTKIDEFHEIIITGKNLKPFYFTHPYKYIRFQKENFQQCPDESRFKVSEKLVYRFISRKLVFVLDQNQFYTLNSANILIPSIENYSNKIICLLFNSILYNFVFQKKFNSLKILKSELEQLPLPIFSEQEKQSLESLYDKIVNGEESFENYNRIIFDYFKLSDEEKIFVKNSVQ